ncbi:hypothetical protein KIPB_013154, partial [Kipferlia bialata]|eukprot:g13154.t1
MSETLLRRFEALNLLVRDLASSGLAIDDEMLLKTARFVLKVARSSKVTSEADFVYHILECDPSLRDVIDMGLLYRKLKALDALGKPVKAVSRHNPAQDDITLETPFPRALYARGREAEPRVQQRHQVEEEEERPAQRVVLDEDDLVQMDHAAPDDIVDVECKPEEPAFLQ